MSTTTTIFVCGTLSALGFTAAGVLPPPQSAADVPWKDLAGGGATLMMLAAIFVFLRHLREENAARAVERAADRKHIETIVEGCNAMTAQLGKDFSDTQTQLIAAVRDDHKVARQELHDLLRDRPRG
jgi:hypothetical protein